MSWAPAKACTHQAFLWVHRGEKSAHSWSDGNEGSCTCQPTLLCAVCDNGLLHEHGFVLLDEVAFPARTDALLN